jgi:hypothetical protein
MLGQILYFQAILTEIDAVEKSLAEAAQAWYELFFQPTVQVMAETNILDDFPQRTQADLFVWLTRHHRQLEEAHGDLVLMKTAALDLEKQHDPGLPVRTWHRLHKRLKGKE